MNRQHELVQFSIRTLSFTWRLLPWGGSGEQSHPAPVGSHQTSLPVGQLWSHAGGEDRTIISRTVQFSYKISFVVLKTTYLDPNSSNFTRLHLQFKKKVKNSSLKQIFSLMTCEESSELRRWIFVKSVESYSLFYIVWNQIRIRIRNTDPKS